MLFEPEHDVLMPLGVNADECVVTTSEDGEVWLPVQNHQGITVHLKVGIRLGTVRSTEIIASLAGGTATSSIMLLWKLWSIHLDTLNNCVITPHCLSFTEAAAEDSSH